MTIIVAMDRERGIGKNNDLMWNLPDDVKFFKESTLGHIVIMGRKNFDSIPEKYRPLPGRENVVITRNKDFKAEGCLVLNSLEACREFYRNENQRKLFVIGGGQIYHLALQHDFVDEMLITHVDNHYDADTFFPDFNVADWNIQTISEHGKDAKHESNFSIVKYTRK